MAQDRRAFETDLEAEDYFSRRPDSLKKVVIAAASALEKGRIAKASALWEQALSADPGLGLIGELPTSPVTKGFKSIHDTREAMRNPEPIGEQPDQSYYFTPEWQEAERQADEDIEAGRMLSFKSAEEAVKSLRKHLRGSE